MVIFIVTPWMANKPKFWICGEEMGRCQYIQQWLGDGGQGHGGGAPTQPGLRNKFLQLLALSLWML